MMPTATPQPGALDGCGAPQPGRTYYRCESRGRYSWGPGPRSCIACGGHIHSWAREDARYCSTACRMRVLRRRRAESRAVTAATPATSSKP